MNPTLTIDLAAVRHNVQAWRDRVAPRPVWAVVKCDAYRTGLGHIARTSLDAGAQRLCVIDIREAQALRELGVGAPIVQICATPHSDLSLAVECDVIGSVQDVECAKALSQLASRAGKAVSAHVAIDSGSGWSGVLRRDTERFAEAVRVLPNVVWEGAWTHIAGQASMAAQLERFGAAIATLRGHGVSVPILHVASSGPALWGATEGAVRIGVGLYGSALGAELGDETTFRTALEVRAPVFMVRRFAEPMPLGYGSTFVAQPGQTIVTLRIGYGEGLPKTLAGTGHAVLQGSLCPIVGNIGMNFTMLLAPPAGSVQVGDEALLLGDVAGVRLDEVAATAQTIPHNIVTMFGSGMSRSYKNLRDAVVR
ncbi:MAG: alanine racemase [Candidatus Eremiobacteraeota bacterium]|nr:alanine racemase [Candidatus Eremiobacteraeota bacterium]